MKVQMGGMNMKYEQAQKLFEFLTDKGLGVEDISKVYDIVKPAVEAEDDNDIETLEAGPKELPTGGKPIPGGAMTELKAKGMDRRRYRRPNLLQMAMDTVLDRKGLKRAASDSDAAKGYNARFPEAARLGSPLPNYGAPKAARTQPTTRAQDESYATRFPEAARIQK
jgi:hypothetical protein